MKNLELVPREEQLQFLNSFDMVLSDIDGVCMYVVEVIEGTAEGMNALRSLDKKIYYVTNNTLRSTETLLELLSKNKLAPEPENGVIYPTLAIVDYLKSINFNKKIQLIGPDQMRLALESNGFDVCEKPPSINSETDCLVELVRTIKLDDFKEIGAIILDIDLKLDMVEYQKATICLQKNPETLLLYGACDKSVPFGNNIILAGPDYFQKGLQESSQVTPMYFSKPYENFNTYLKKVCNITDPKRVLFIGDSVPQDMGLAVMAGYTKLLTLSGVTTMEMVKNWPYDEALKPEYFVESVACFQRIISQQ